MMKLGKLIRVIEFRLGNAVIRSRVCDYTELSEARHNYTECPTPNIGTIRSLASYLLRLEQKQICMKKVVERIDIDDIGN